MRTSVDVHNYLQARDIPHEIFLLNSPTRTAERAAALLGLNLCEIIKTVIFFIDGEPVAVVTCGDKKVSYKKLKKVLGTSRVRLATPEEVVELTGYVVGATPPFCFENKIRILIDKSVLDVEVVYTGGGEINAMLKMKSQDLQGVTQGEIVDVTD